MCEHGYFDIVYLRTDQEQHPRMVTGILMRAHCYMYELQCGAESSWHYPEEIVVDKIVY